MCIIRDNPNCDCIAALPVPRSVTVQAAECVPQMCSPGPDAAEKSHSAHEGTNGMVSLQHVFKRFPGQGPE